MNIIYKGGETIKLKESKIKDFLNNVSKIDFKNKEEINSSMDNIEKALKNNDNDLLNKELNNLIRLIGEDLIDDVIK